MYSAFSIYTVQAWAECKKKRLYNSSYTLECSLLKDDQRNRGRGGMQRDRWGDIYANTPTKKMIALYDYDPLELSPNVDSEVTDAFNK